MSGARLAAGQRQWLAVLVTVSLLAGCAGDSAVLLASGAQTVSSQTSALDDISKATPDTVPFDPFSNRTENDRPAREVIEAPTRADVLKSGALAEFSIGRSDAPVTIVKYMSLTCPYCRQFQADVFPVLEREYIKTGKVRLIIREFPIGKTSGTATIALRCAPMDKYLQLYGRFLAQQSAWVSQDIRPDAIFAVAQQVGMTRAQFDACLKNQDMIDGLKWVKERGRQLGIIGTPNFYVENRLVKRVVGMSDIRQMVDPLLAGR